jgi:hypothetical protein
MWMGTVAVRARIRADFVHVDDIGGDGKPPAPLLLAARLKPHHRGRGLDKLHHRQPGIARRLTLFS